MHLFCLKLNQHQRLQFFGIDDCVGSTFGSQLYFHRDERFGIAVLLDQSMQELLSDPLLRR